MFKPAISLLLLLSAIDTSASIIKTKPVKIEDIPYPDLICRPEDHACIYEIITTVAETSAIGLAFKKEYLDMLGAKIDKVHPMKFFTAIYNHPQLRVCLERLWTDSFKRAGFLDGFATSMTLYAEKKQLNQHIKAFAEELNISAKEIAPYFETQDWESLVSHILRM
jgi:hypothetical protein